MKSLIDHLSTYAAYHRDRRNVATHFVGVPLIVLSVAALLSRPALGVCGGVALAPALLVALAAGAFYLALDLRLGAAMVVLLTLALRGGAALALGSTALWLGGGLGLFVVGWTIQFIGHVFEGRKPAFVDDLIGLAIGPLFIVTEAAFALGLRLDLRHQIEARLPQR